MKTPQEAAREYAESYCDKCLSRNNNNCAPGKDKCASRKRNIRNFLAGDAFGYRRGMEEAYRWISVEDELPENEAPVIARIKTVEVEEGEIIYGVCAYIGKGIWVNQFGVVHGQPTHWRPIERVKE